MKILALILAFVLFACTTTPAPQKPAPTLNLAAAFVHKVDADVPCDEYYTDVGAHHVHSVVCKLPNKVLVYCTITDDTWPTCKPIDGSDAKPARGPEPPPPTPKPVDPPPAPASSPPKPKR